MNIQRDLMYDDSVNNVSVILGAHSRGALKQKSDAYHVNCTLDNTDGYSVCGIGFQLSESIVDGVDLGAFHTISLSLVYRAPLDNPRLRVSFRNYDPLYSTPEDDVSLKFNSITYEPAKHPSVINVPLNAFYVESWWVEQFEIDFENAQLDFSNIVFIEILSNSMPAIGQYDIEVMRVVLIGEIISEAALLRAILLFWAIAIILLVSVQRHKLKAISNTDALTGLLNRRGLDNWVSKSKDSFSSSAILTMFYFDIDDFKKVNDTYGHLVGDELLCSFCEKVSNAAVQSIKGRYKYAFSRLAGDEFALITKNLPPNMVTPFATAIMASLVEPVSLSSHKVKLKVSLGIAHSQDNNQPLEELMMRADSAMYLAKKQGKNQFKVFDDSAAKEIFFRKQVAEKLKTALEENLFTLLFMPIFDIETAEITGSEVLVRCTAENLEGVGPDKFIPIAEQYDLIQDIDLWVIEATLKILAAKQQLVEGQSLKFNINISALELHNKQFPKLLSNLIKKYNVEPSVLVLEITETSLVEVDNTSIAILDELKSTGVSIALDDFGTGYTAFSQLTRYPVDCLKIDRSFIKGLGEASDTPKTTINAILSIAKSYKLETVAEGVESQAELAYLKAHGCDKVQGYYFSQPLTWEVFHQHWKEAKETTTAD